MPTMICPKCNYQTDKKDPFCCKCGTKMIPVQESFFCKACGQKLSNNDQFCGRCGARQKPISWWIILAVILSVISVGICSYYMSKSNAELAEQGRTAII